MWIDFKIQMSLLEQGMGIMKKDRSDGLDRLVQSLDEELKKLMKKVGYKKELKSVSYHPLLYP